MTTFKEIDDAIKNSYIDLCCQESHLKSSIRGFPKRQILIMNDKNSTKLTIIIEDSHFPDNFFETKYFRIKCDLIMQSITNIPQNLPFLLFFNYSDIPLDKNFLKISEAQFQQSSNTLGVLNHLFHLSSITLNILSPIKTTTAQSLQGNRLIYRVEVSDLLNYETTLYCSESNSPIINQISSLYSKKIYQITFSNLRVAHILCYTDQFLSKKLQGIISNETSILKSNWSLIPPKNQNSIFNPMYQIPLELEKKLIEKEYGQDVVINDY